MKNLNGFLRRISLIVITLFVVIGSSPNASAGLTSEQRDAIAGYVRSWINKYFNSRGSGQNDQTTDVNVSEEVMNSMVTDIVGAIESDGATLESVSNVFNVGVNRITEEDEEEDGNNSSGNPGSPFPPDTTTDDPFEGVTTTGDEDTGTNQPVSQTELPYGSVPLIGADPVSVDYILQKLIDDAQAKAVENGESPESAPVLAESYYAYAENLAKTLSGMSQEDQNYIFYGVR